MSVWSLARRAARWVLRWWWQQARPSRGARLGAPAPARPEHETGRPPLPEERWVATTEPTGPWAEVDPHALPAWPRRGQVLGFLAWAGLVAVRVRRELRDRGATPGA